MGDFILDQRKVEQILSFMTKTCTSSVAVGGIPSVEEQADELITRHGGNVAAAADQAARIEEGASWREKLPDVLLQLVPIVGDSTLLLRKLWRNIRRCALIAHLYGHDLAATETQAMILTCLISTGNGNQPQGGTGEGPSGSHAPGGDSGGTGGSAGMGGGTVVLAGAVASSRASSREVVNVGGRILVVSVSRALLREAFVRGTGLKYAGMLYSVVESGGMSLGRRYRSPPTGSAAMMLVEKPTAALPRPQAAPSTPSVPSGHAVQGGGQGQEAWGESESSAQIGGTTTAASSGGAVSSTGPPLPLQQHADSGEELSAAKVALVMFRPPNAEERPEAIAGLVFLWLLPIIVAAIRFAWERLVPMFRRRVQMELSVGRYVMLILAAQLAGLVVWWWLKRNRTIFVSVPATLVFVLYAVLPGISIFMAMRSILQGASEAPFFVLLGVFNWLSGYSRWADDLRSDAELEQRPAPLVAAGRERAQALREFLWLLLSVDFALEELLGRVFRLHSLRFLGPPISSAGMTLFEYRTFAFAMGLGAAWAQTRVLDLLQRRTVLMRLLGAKQAITAGASLLFMGISAVSQYKNTVSWLDEVSPSPRMCCIVLWIRQFGAVFGCAMPLVMYVLLKKHCLGALPPDVLVPLALLCGSVLGHCFCWSMTRIWRERGEDLGSDYRVLYLFPRTSANGRRLASQTMRSAKKRCAEGATSTAVEWAASRIVRKGFDVFTTRMLAA